MIALIARVTSSPLATFLVSWAAIFLACAAWAMGSPLGATPDEPSHVIKAASVARGELIGTEGADPSRTLVDVPVGIAQAWNWACHARELSISAGCIPPLSHGLDLAEAETSAGLYNPAYYALVGWPSLLIADTLASVLAMRLVSALLVSAMIAFAFAIAIRLAPPLPVGIVFGAAVTPMVLYLGGAITPNGVEIAATVAVGVGLLSLALSEERPRIAVLIGIAVAAVVGANARGISPLWIAAAMLLAAVAAPSGRLAALLRLGRVRVMIGVIAAGIAAAAAWTLATGSLGALGAFPGADVSPAEAALVMVTRVADPGIIGLFGWGETVPPSLVYFVWSSLIAAVVVGSVALTSGRRLRAVVAGLAAIVLLPAVVQAASISTTGYIWQGRYSLAIVATVIVMAGILAAPRLSSVTNGVMLRLAVIAAIAVLVGQVWALAAAILRYARAGTNSPLALFREADWSPPGGPILWLCVLGIGIGGLAAVWLGAGLAGERRRAGAASDEPIENLRAGGVLGKKIGLAEPVVVARPGDL